MVSSFLHAIRTQADERLTVLDDRGLASKLTLRGVTDLPRLKHPGYHG